MQWRREIEKRTLKQKHLSINRLRGFVGRLLDLVQVLIVTKTYKNNTEKIVDIAPRQHYEAIFALCERIPVRPIQSATMVRYDALWSCALWFDVTRPVLLKIKPRLHWRQGSLMVRILQLC